MDRRATADSHGTERVGAELAAHLQPGDVVLLSGELGAGKTTFVRGAARALGVSAPVTSPTFAIGNRYPVPTTPATEPGTQTGAGAAGVGPAAVSHLDLYRLGDLGAEDPDLLADYLAGDTVAFIEWPGGAEGAIARLGRVRFRVEFEHAGGDRRRITVMEA